MMLIMSANMQIGYNLTINRRPRASRLCIIYIVLALDDISR